MHSQTTPASNRLCGLDTLRALAIILVLMCHYSVVVSHEQTFGFLSGFGWVGVDLFFVLSGYLIGNQVLSAIAQEKPFSLKLFYIRRLLRTLPNYYVVLALYFMLPTLLSGSHTASIWSFLSFTQNMGMRPGETFTHSWSLCIEEQFYLLFPLFVLAIASIKRFRQFTWISILSCILIANLLRAYNWHHYGQASINISDYWEHIYYSSFTRFDELLPGIAIALLKNFHPILFAKLQQKAHLLTLAGIASTAAIFYLLVNYFYIDGYGYSGLIASLGFSGIALSFALLVLAALCPNSWLYKIHIPGAANLALWSYAIYLIHKPIFALLINPLTQYGIDVKSALGISIIMGVSLVSGWLLYQCIETPFMKLREHFYPVSKATPKVSCTLSSGITT